MTTDLTVPESRSERDRLAARTDVLDKVGVLRMLPGDMYVNTEAVATFYEVTPEVVRQTVVRNRTELEADGISVVRRSEVSDKLSLTPDEIGMPRTAPTLGLFPRRAVLRIGMLLRDSAVALRVRTYLLDAEVRPVAALPDITTAAGVLEMARLLTSTAERLVVSEQRVRELAGPAAQAETMRSADGLCTIGDLANRFKVYAADRFPGIKVRHQDVWDHAARLGLVIRGNTVRHNEPTARAIEAGWCKAHDHVYATNTRGDQTARSTRLTPRGEGRLWDGMVSWVHDHGALAIRRSA